MQLVKYYLTTFWCRIMWFWMIWMMSHWLWEWMMSATCTGRMTFQHYCTEVCPKHSESSLSSAIWRHSGVELCDFEWCGWRVIGSENGWWVRYWVRERYWVYIAKYFTGTYKAGWVVLIAHNVSQLIQFEIFRVVWMICHRRRYNSSNTSNYGSSIKR